jgi:hypothetical protein
MRLALFSKACIALALLAGIGCGGGGSGNCPSIAGTWVIRTHCQASFVGQTATINQSGCSLSVSPPFNSFTGSIGASGSVSISNGTVSCTGALSGDTIQLSCQPPCDLSIQKQ